VTPRVRPSGDAPAAHGVFERPVDSEGRERREAEAPRKAPDLETCRSIGSCVAQDRRARLKGHSTGVTRGGGHGGDDGGADEQRAGCH
jgi:hypothetical protein